MKKIIAVIILNIISVNCYASMNIPNQAPTGMYSFNEGFDQGNRWGNNMMAQAQAAEMYKLQVEERRIRYMHYLATHPQVAKELANKQEVQDIIKRNSGFTSLFKSRKAYLAELKQCAKHGNKYCTNVFKRELIKRNK